MHNLLEGDRIVNLEVTNNDILNKDIRYYLGNFSPDSAKKVIESLTQRSSYLEPSLIDELVRDLAEEQGEVRPIELQIVGAQLETEKITTLKEYQQKGPKEQLVQRFLEQVVRDCGQEDERIAQLVLYFLTDEKNDTRPSRTRAELLARLEDVLPTEPGTLELVLKILVKSGIVFLIPQLSTNYYQLVHDYFVSFIRQQRGAQLYTELKREKEKRQLAEAQRLRIAYGAGLGIGVLATVAVGFSLKSTIGEINAQLSAHALSSERLFAANLHEQALIESIKAGEKLQQTIWANLVEANTKILVKTALRQAVYESFGKELKTLTGHEDAVRSVSFSPDGKTIASASSDKTVKLWDISSGKEPKTLRHSFKVWSVGFSPDGKTIASASDDGTVKLWDTSSGKELRTLKGHLKAVRSVSFSPDGKTIASASEDKKVKLWETSSGKELKTFERNSFALWSVKFSPDGKKIASASSNGEVLLWDTSSGKSLRTLSRHSSDVWDINFSPDGKTIASVSRDGTVILWDTSSGVKLKTLKGHLYSLWSVSFSLDGKKIAAASWDGTVILWDTSSGRELKTFEGHSGEVWGISFSPDGKTIASASDDKTVKLWDVSSRELKTLEGHSAGVRNVSFSPNGKMIASVGSDETIINNGKINGTIILWDTSSGKKLKKPKIKGHSSEVWSVSFSPDSKRIASASWDGTVKLWDTSSGTLLKTLPSLRDAPPTERKANKENLAEVWSVSFSPDGKTIASASSDKTVKLWDISSDKEPKTLKVKGHLAAVRSVSFSPDGKTIASASDDKTVKLWDISSDKEPKTFKGHSAEVRSVSFSPDGKMIASASSDKTVKLWDVSSGTEIKTFQGHSAEVWSVSFSPDGKTIASASDDGTVKLWDVSSGRELQTLRYSAEVLSVSFSPDGKMIASANSDGTVIVWNLDTENLLSLGCNWLKDNPSLGSETLEKLQICQQTPKTLNAAASAWIAQGKQPARDSKIETSATTSAQQKPSTQTTGFSCNSAPRSGLSTYVVKPLDNRVGFGIRCVKFSDGGGNTIPSLAWYGEGKWGGKKYRHVGHAFYNNGRLIGSASNIYGNGEDINGNFNKNLDVKIVNQSTIRVKDASGAWNEEWKKQDSPIKYEPLPMPYTKCGEHFNEYSVSDLRNSRQQQGAGGLRCILRVGTPNTTTTTTWFGNGKWENTGYTHLGTLSSKGYGADDICNTPFCNTFEYGLLKLTPDSDNSHDFNVTGAWSEKWKKKK